MTTRVDPIEALRGANRSTIRTGSVPRRTLVVVQAALSLALLTAAGLLTSTLYRLQNQNFGFAQDNRLVVYADPTLAGFPPQQLTPLYGRIHDSLAAIPGVSAVALCIYTPMGNNNFGAAIWVDGHPPPAPGEDNGASWERATPGYFDVIGDPIIRGRALSDHDTASSVHVAVINEAFARKFFPNEDPIGKHFGQGFGGSGRQYEIVGISRNTRYFPNDLDKPARPFFVLPETQHDISRDSNYELSPSSHYLRNIVIVVKPGIAPPIAQIRQAMASVAPDMPVMSIRTMREQVAAQFTQEQLIARLTSFFGLLSLILASIGLYGVTAYNAGQRVNEIGVRMAVGSDRSRIIALILRGALALILIGLVIGLPLALAAGRFLGSQLYEVSPYNPVVISTAVAALALSALIASFVPAFRASLIAPLDALRAE